MSRVCAWRSASLADVATVDPEQINGSRDQVIDYIALEDVRKGRIVASTRVRLEAAPSRARRRLRDEDVLFGTVRPNLQPHAQYRGGLKNPVASTGFAVIRARDGEALPAFLAQWVLSSDVSRQVERLIAGSNYPAVSSRDVRLFQLRLPDMAAQSQIAAALGDADDHIAALEQMIAKKQAIKQGMMQQLLTGKTRLPGFTKPWLNGTFEQLAHPSRERAMPQTVAPATPLIALDQIEGGSGRLLGRSQASEAVSLKAVFQPDDVLFGKLRAYLRKFWYADAAGLCTTEIWVLRARVGVHGRFVRYIVETDQFIDAASGAYGTHMPRSDWGIVRALPVAIPPHDEQVAIASALGDVDAEIGLLHQRLAKARDVKHGMAQELLAGRTGRSVTEAAA